ncbi:MAG: BACON domain-containing protein, partial [Candidatus Scalinduaceae bacterium]
MKKLAVFPIIVSFAIICMSPRSTAAQETIYGAPGTSIQQAVINFSELAQQEALYPAVPKAPKVPPYMPVPGNLPLPSGIAPSSTPQVGSGTDNAFTELEPVPEAFIPSPAPSKNFLAIDDNNTSIPPDTHGAVGPNHLMVTLNTQVRIQNRSGTALSTVSMDGFWASLGNPNAFDPKVLYDHLNNRWMFTACADSFSASSAQLIAVSQTSDPTGNWNLFRIDADPTNTNWVDFPSMGFNKDWIVVSVNMFTIAGGIFQGTNIYVFKKIDLYNNVAGTHTLIQTTTLGGTHVPATTYSSTLSRIYLINRWDSNAGMLRLYEITGVVGNEMLTPIGFPTSPENWAGIVPDNFAPQLGSGTGIMVNDARIGNLLYRNDTLWTTHTVFLPTVAPSRSSIQWWQIATDASILQRGRIDDSVGGNFYAFPSIAVNKNDDVLIGYSRFSANQFASGNYSFRSGTDPANIMRDDAVLKAGEDTYIKDVGSGRVRWGDYSNTVVDPVNDIDMWTIQEYAATDVGPTASDDRWGTWWGLIKLTQSCTFSISPTSHFFSESGGTGSVSVSALGGCTWTASSNASWITITSGSSGSGNGTVSYSVSLNPVMSSRKGIMTIAGQTFTVIQKGEFVFDDVIIDFGAAGIWVRKNDAGWIPLHPSS